MYVNGRDFVGSAILLRRKQGSEYVVLHLLCQGIEITLKAFLLLRDYSRFEPKIRGFGHDLLRLVDVVCAEFCVRQLSPAERSQLEALNGLYSRHWLRYPSSYNVLVDAATIPADLVLKKVFAVLRLAERVLGPSLLVNPALSVSRRGSASSP